MPVLMLQLTKSKTIWTESLGQEQAGGIERSSPTSSTRISLIGVAFGGWEESEEYLQASA